MKMQVCDISENYTCPKCHHKMYDKKKADRTIKFFKTYLHHTTGSWHGKPFGFVPWEEKLIRIIYGVVRLNGLRLYRKIFVFIAKKNGKSELASGIALYSMFADGEPGAEVYSSAGDREQASIVYGTAIKMVRMNRKLRKISKILESTKRIKYLRTDSFYKVLSSDVKTKHGINPQCSIIDELHVVPKEQYEVLTVGVGAARKQPVIFMITTAGDNQLSICYEEYNYGKQIQNGVIQDNTYLPMIFEMDENDDWKDEKNWFKANPSLDHTIQLEDMLADFKQAMLRPSQINKFRQLRLNQWVSSHSKWLSIEDWKKCYDPQLDWKTFKGEICNAGLDLASTIDITAFVALFQQEIDGLTHYYPYCKFWCPEETIQIRSRKDRIDYDKWVKQGFLTPTPGNSIDQKFIERVIIRFEKEHRLQQVNVDRWNASQIITNLQEEGITMVGFGQGYRSMSTPSKETEILILQKRIHHDGNPVLAWMIDNAIVQMDPAGNIKPDKAKSKDKIDGLVAFIMALDAWIRQTISVYEKRGLKTV
jgi:phage terminase large subunit-like protein